MRNAHSQAMFGEKADRKPNTAKIPIVIVKPRLRPMRSEMVPQNQAPASMPTNFEATTTELWNVVRPKSSVIFGSAKAMMKISAASAAQVTPQVFQFPERRRGKDFVTIVLKGDGYGRRSAAASAVSMVRAMSCTPCGVETATR
jgi:hypothetical protein